MAGVGRSLAPEKPVDDYGLPLKQLHFLALCVEQPINLWSLHPQITQRFSDAIFFTQNYCMRSAMEMGNPSGSRHTANLIFSSARSVGGITNVTPRPLSSLNLSVR